jgi:signal transduction histidine kinase
MRGSIFIDSIDPDQFGGMIDISSDKIIVIRIFVVDIPIEAPLENQSIIFAAFPQVDASIARKHRGAGPGLAM